MCNYNVIPMRTRIIRIGNSRGVRIPKPLLEEAGLTDDVELELDGNRLILRPAERPRSGWDDAFRRMAEAGEDAMIDGDAWPPTRWDRDSWRW